MSTSSSLRQQFGAFCTNVPLGVRTLLEAPGLTTTLTAPKTALCVSPPLGKRFSSTGSTVGGVLGKKRRSRRPVCVHPWTKGSFHHFRQAGGMAAVSLAMPTKLWDSAGRECGRTFLYLQRELLIKLSNSIGLFPWSFMFSPPNLAEFLCSLALQPTRSAPLVSADLRNNLC